MFSRKKNDLLIVSIDEDRRSFLRVESSTEEPIDISIGCDGHRVNSIGAKGIGIYRRSEEKELEVGKEYPFKMNLPFINEEILGSIRIVDISDRACHCAFIDLSEEEKEKIHLYVLQRQKEELREKRRS